MIYQKIFPYLSKCYEYGVAKHAKVYFAHELKRSKILFLLWSEHFRTRFL